MFFTALNSNLATVHHAKIDGTPTCGIINLNPTSGEVGNSVVLLDKNLLVLHGVLQRHSAGPDQSAYNIKFGLSADPSLTTFAATVWPHGWKVSRPSRVPLPREREKVVDCKAEVQCRVRVIGKKPPPPACINPLPSPSPKAWMTIAQRTEGYSQGGGSRRAAGPLL
jgi:hypothetical protein